MVDGTIAVVSDGAVVIGVAVGVADNVSMGLLFEVPSGLITLK